VVENVLEVCGRVAGVAGGVHHKAGVVRLVLFVGDDHGCRNPIRVPLVVVGAAPLELHLSHELARDGWLMAFLSKSWGRSMRSFHPSDLV
jgi:hypothetical protein